MQRHMSRVTVCLSAFLALALAAPLVASAAPHRQHGPAAAVNSKKKKKKPVATRGAKGDTGATGAKGDTGAAGAPGPKGDTGPAGPKGDAGPAGIAGGTAPRGVTVRGTFNVGYTAAAIGDITLGAFSFGYRFTALPKVTIVPFGGVTPPECNGGTLDEPDASPGYLCVFMQAVQNSDGLNVNPKKYRSGITFYAVSNAAGSFYVQGSWAATAP